MRTRTYHNAVLTVVALLLGALVIGRFDREPSASVTLAQATPPPRAAWSDPEEAGAAARVSAAEQRKAIIAQLKDVSSRLDRIEATLKAGLDVRVKEMPASKPNE